MFPSKLFHYCPRCGQPLGPRDDQPCFTCAACGFRYYFNPAVAVAGLVLDATGRGLFIRRAKDPARGKLALPGGFIDQGETAEKAFRRELREEVNLEVGPLSFLSSHPNEYRYADVTYPVLDLFFTAPADGPAGAIAREEVESLSWLDPASVALEDIAFPSMRAALRHYLAPRA